jgi:Domain of unknown function (DUF4335)
MERLNNMNIKRQYSLPSCNLILEGLEDSATENVDILDGQSPMSILINAECNFLSSNQQLSGGSVFLENLAKAVSNYAQGFLSGLPHPQPEATQYPHVSVTKIAEDHRHRLILEPEPASGEAKTAIELTTIELFDLVDAIDQFYIDRHTLPDMSLELQSVSKRHRKPEQPLAERATPAVVGIASLTLAAVAFFFIPPPVMRQPEPDSKSAPTETIPVNPQSVPPGTAPNTAPNNSETK